MNVVSRTTVIPSQFTAEELGVLVDLLENKLDCMEVADLEDQLEFHAIQGALIKIAAMIGRKRPAPTLRLVKGPARR